MRGRSIKRKISTQQNKEKGITLVALVVTIVVLLILAGITVTMLFSENGIIKKAQQAAENTNREEIIGRIRNDILAKRTETLEKITETDLKKILKNYGTLSDNGEETILDKTLETSVGKINVRDIYDGPIAKAEMITCYFNDTPLTFALGEKWDNRAGLMRNAPLDEEIRSAFCGGDPSTPVYVMDDSSVGDLIKLTFTLGSTYDNMYVYKTVNSSERKEVKWGDPFDAGARYYTGFLWELGGDY